MAEPRNIYQSVLRVVEWVALAGAIVSCWAFLLGFEFIGYSTISPGLTMGPVLVLWAVAGVLSRVPQSDRNRDPDRLKVSTLFAVRMALLECAGRCQYDGDSWDERNVESRRDASFRASGMAETALKMLERDYEL